MMKRSVRPFARVFAAGLLCVLFAGSAFAAINIPAPTAANYVNDYANVLSQSTEDEIFEIGKALEAATSAELVYVSIPSLEGNDLEEYALELGRQWGNRPKSKRQWPADSACYRQS